MPFEYAPASGPPARPRSLTALPPALAALVLFCLALVAMFVVLVGHVRAPD